MKSQEWVHLQLSILSIASSGIPLRILLEETEICLLHIDDAEAGNVWYKVSKL